MSEHSSFPKTKETLPQRLLWYFFASPKGPWASLDKPSPQVLLRWDPFSAWWLDHFVFLWTPFGVFVLYRSDLEGMPTTWTRYSKHIQIQFFLAIFHKEPKPSKPKSITKSNPTSQESGLFLMGHRRPKESWWPWQTATERNALRGNGKAQRKVTTGPPE